MPATRAATQATRDEANRHLLIKLLYKDRTHHGYTYQLGLNKLPSDEVWNHVEGIGGGLYCCRLEHIFHWIWAFGPNVDVAIVSIPPDASSVEYATQLKASALVVERVQLLGDTVACAVRCGVPLPDQFLRHSLMYGFFPLVRWAVASQNITPETIDYVLQYASEHSQWDKIKYLGSLL